MPWIYLDKFPQIDPYQLLAKSSRFFPRFHALFPSAVALYLCLTSFLSKEMLIWHFSFNVLRSFLRFEFSPNTSLSETLLLISLSILCFFSFLVLHFADILFWFIFLEQNILVSTSYLALDHEFIYLSTFYFKKLHELFRRGMKLSYFKIICIKKGIFTFVFSI